MKYFFIFISLLFISCEKKSPNNYAFYYWRTEFNLNKTEKELLQKSTSKDFYIRIFDLDKKEGNISKVGEINFKQKLDFEQNIVPVIFITNRTWESATENDFNFATNTIYNSIKKLEENSNKKISEIQIDCDWTNKTKTDYFKFLEKLKAKTQKEISCTLRLHQVKDKKETGIPPVKKVYLMCYATSSPLENLEKNTILDVPTLKNYLSKLEDYPVKMNVALPIYSWGIVTNHLGKRKLINALTEEDLKTQNFEKLGNSTYKILKDGFYFGMYLNKNFTIKVEPIPEKDIIEVQKFIDQKIKYPHLYIYYHLDSKFTNRYKNLF